MSTTTTAATTKVAAEKVAGKPLNNDMRAKYARLTVLRDEKRAIEAEAKELTEALLADMGTHEVALFGGIKVFRVITASRTNVNAKLLAEAFPEAYQAVTSESTYKSIR